MWGEGGEVLFGSREVVRREQELRIELEEGTVLDGITRNEACRKQQQEGNMQNYEESLNIQVYHTVTADIHGTEGIYIIELLLTRK